MTAQAYWIHPRFPYTRDIVVFCNTSPVLMKPPDTAVSPGLIRIERQVVSYMWKRKRG